MFRLRAIPWLLAMTLWAGHAAAQDSGAADSGAGESSAGESSAGESSAGESSGDESSADESADTGSPSAPLPPPPALPAPALPAPTLPDPEPIAPAEPEPEPGPEEEGPDAEVLFRITREEDNDPLPADVGFEIPGGDLRTTSAVQGQVPAILQGTPPRRRASPDPEGEQDEVLPDPESPPPTFNLAAGGGWSRWATPTGERDYLRVEQRFAFRVPDFEALRVGAGVAQLVGFNDQDVLVEGGVRFEYGFFFCRESWARCEGVIAVQPGVIGGDLMEVNFDFNAGLDLRFLLEELVELSVGAAYSLVGSMSLVHVSALAGVVF